MAQHHVRYRTLTLQASLEELVRLEDEFLLVGAEEKWRARDLLAYLQGERPNLLDLPVALVPPDATGAGVVVEVDLAGEPLAVSGRVLSRRLLPSIPQHTVERSNQQEYHSQRLLTGNVECDSPHRIEADAQEPVPYAFEAMCGIRSTKDGPHQYRYQRSTNAQQDFYQGS